MVGDTNIHWLTFVRQDKTDGRWMVCTHSLIPFMQYGNIDWVCMTLAGGVVVTTGEYHYCHFGPSHGVAAWPGWRLHTAEARSHAYHVKRFPGCLRDPHKHDTSD